MLTGDLTDTVARHPALARCHLVNAQLTGARLRGSS
jgi:hypothetical protein